MLSFMDQTGQFLTLKIDINAVPKEILSDREGSWSYDTMNRRILKEIYPRILKDNFEYLASHPIVREKLCALESNMGKGRDGVLVPITDDGSDSDIWNSLILTDKLATSVGSDWLSSPWLISEFYFYRKVIEAFNYSHSKYDMFAIQKLAGLHSSLEFINSLAITVAARSTIPHDSMELAIYSSLWGNKLDLSLWPKTIVALNEGVGHHDDQSAAGTMIHISNSNDHLQKYKSYILDDNSGSLFMYLDSLSHREEVVVDIIVDNAGYELVSDFMLAYILLKSHISTKIRFHTKAYPTFVSDATTSDCLQTIDYLLTKGEEYPDIAHWAADFEELVQTQKIEFLENCYWCQPFAFWEMPVAIHELLKDSVLVVVKGDANYRRLLGDRQWPFATPVKDILNYWHVPVCALRVLKAEIACGINEEKQVEASLKDANWLVSGKWAVVQFFNPLQ